MNVPGRYPWTRRIRGAVLRFWSELRMDVDAAFFPRANCRASVLVPVRSESTYVRRPIGGRGRV